MRTCAIVPVKRLLHSKARLAPSMNPGERRDLTLKMLRHVLSELTGWIGQAIVVGSDEEVRKVAESSGALFELDQASSLNSAVTQAISRCMAEGFDSVLVIAADLPLLSCHELKNMLNNTADESIVICPSKDCGTNALLLRPPRSIPVRFGSRSLTGHLNETMRSGRRFKLYWSLGLTFDLDTAADLQMLRKTGFLACQNPSSWTRRRC